MKTASLSELCAISETSSRYSCSSSNNALGAFDVVWAGGSMNFQSTITSEVEGRKFSTRICYYFIYGGRRYLLFLLFSVFMVTMTSNNPQAQEVNISKALRALLLQRVCRGMLWHSVDSFDFFLAQEIQKSLLHININKNPIIHININKNPIIQK